jgi:hypothetical protein
MERTIADAVKQRLRNQHTGSLRLSRLGSPKSAPQPKSRSVSKVERVPRTSIQKVNGFPAVPHALDILAAVALIYGAEGLAGFVGAPGIASVRSAMSKAERLSDASAPECIGLQRHQRRLAD